MGDCIIILAGAFLLDLMLGDPVYRLHPVRLLGHFIAWLERRLFSGGCVGFFGGGLLFFGSLLAAAGIFLAAALLWHVFPAAGLLIFTFLVYSTIGFRDMFNHVLPVYAALAANDAPNARRLLQRIVGRDVSRLDRDGMSRAAVETVAENFVDGLLSIIFWFAAGGIGAWVLGLAPAPAAVGMALMVRVANTLDAMVGYRNQRYKHFGTVSARADDFFNFIPARLSMVIIGLAAAICRMDAARCIKTGFRDRLKHASPNAGHPESCIAGALGIRLGGPAIYPGKTVDKPWMGKEINPVVPEHIRSACVLVFCAGWVGMLPVIFIFARLMMS